MKFAGKVTAVLGQKLLVAQSDAGQLPPLYSEVANSSGEPIGKIVDLYGSVANPYLTVLCKDRAEAVVGEELFVLPNTSPEKSKKPYRNKSGYQGGQSRRPKSGGSIWKQKSRS